ncbi:hypothetical protein IT575_08735 [bacterium]|nr:hypothetical protein [bacterium]
MFILLSCVCIAGALLVFFSGRKKLQYPAGWPLPELSAPGDAVAFSFGKSWDIGTTCGWTSNCGHSPPDMTDPFPQDRYYLIFKSDQSWPELLQHIDDSLRPLGYQICVTDRTALWRAPGPGPVWPAGDEFEYQANYVSADLHTYLNIYKTHLCYVYDIGVYSNPIDPANSIGLEDMRPIP